MAGGFARAAVLLAGLVAAASVSGQANGEEPELLVFASIPGDHHYPKGYCKQEGECDLRGAWNEAMDKTSKVVILLSLQEVGLVYPLIGKKGGRVTLIGRGNPTISLNSTVGEHHSEFIRWFDFDSTAHIYLSHVTVTGFRLSEPDGPPVQEFGGAINLGRKPIQSGYPSPDACEDYTEPPLNAANVVFNQVTFSKNAFVNSEPPIHDAYGAAVAISCPGCNVSFKLVSFTDNSAEIEGTAHGILWMNVAKFTQERVTFTGNKIHGKTSIICPTPAITLTRTQ